MVQIINSIDQKDQIIQIDWVFFDNIKKIENHEFIQKVRSVMLQTRWIESSYEWFREILTEKTTKKP